MPHLLTVLVRPLQPPQSIYYDASLACGVHPVSVNVQPAQLCSFGPAACIVWLFDVAAAGFLPKGWSPARPDLCGSAPSWLLLYMFIVPVNRPVDIVHLFLVPRM